MNKDIVRGFQGFQKEKRPSNNKKETAMTPPFSFFITSDSLSGNEQSKLRERLTHTLRVTEMKK